MKLHVGSPMVGVIHIAGFIVQIINKKNFQKVR